MDFGRVAHIDGIDFRLPPDPDGGTGDLLTVPFPGARLRLGLTGWAEKEWVGDLYPQGSRRESWLTWYARSLDSIEFNSTFYGLPPPERVKKWLAETPDDFHFIPKVWQSISRAADLGTSTGDLQSFLSCMDSFDHRAPAAFLQMPPAATPANRGAGLEQLLRQWPSSYRLFLEVRNPAWLEDATIPYLLQEKGCGWVITDTPGRRDLVHMRRSIPATMVRFVACGNPEADKLRLQDWADRLNQWFASGMEQAWFFCHEPDNRKAPELARLFHHILRKNSTDYLKDTKIIKDYGRQSQTLF